MQDVLMTEAPHTIQLSSGKKGGAYRIVELAGDRGLCRKLREMGIREKMEIHIVIARKNLVCLVGGSRFAISHLYAACIFVEPLS